MNFDLNSRTDAIQAIALGTENCIKPTKGEEMFWRCSLLDFHLRCAHNVRTAGTTHDKGSILEQIPRAWAVLQSNAPGSKVYNNFTLLPEPWVICMTPQSTTKEPMAIIIHKTEKTLCVARQ